MATKTLKKCQVCKGDHEVRVADLKRGWGKTCSKSCAATLTNRKTGNYQRYIQNKDYQKDYCSGQGFVPLSIADHDPNKDRE